MPIHRKINFTPYPVDFGLCQDRDGRDLVSALLKATFYFTSKGRLTAAEKEAALPIFLSDVYYDKPDTSSLRYAGEVVPEKKGVDVAINGHVYSFDRRPVVAGFRLGPIQKTVRVHGPRSWLADGAKDIAGPLPFDSVRLRYELAYGGFYFDQAGSKVVYDQNPVGVGFAEAARAQAILPSIEYPDAGIASAQDRPPPAGLGFIPAGWRQRGRFAGTFDDAWHKTRRPLFPSDFDARFYNSVPQDQVLPGELRGGEQVLLQNVHPQEPLLQVSLPTLKHVCQFVIKNRTKEVPMRADTLLIEPDKGRLAITFRASLFIGNDFKFIKSISWKSVS
jgi:hypothetical protein